MPSARAPRQAKTAKLDQQTLLGAALTVFGREGFAGASIRAIAREAGCDPSLIYYYFENKEAVFAAILDQRLPPLVAALRKLARARDSRSTAEKLWTVIGIFHTHVNDSGFRSMVRSQIGRGADGIPQLLTRKLLPARMAMQILVRRGQRQGELRPELHPDLILVFLVRMEAEMLDLVPVFARTMLDLPVEAALSLAERTWFDVFWRGVAVAPLEPLPFLPPLPLR